MKNLYENTVRIVKEQKEEIQIFIELIADETYSLYPTCNFLCKIFFKMNSTASATSYFTQNIIRPWSNA